MHRSKLLLATLLTATLGSFVSACGSDDDTLFGDSGSGAGSSTGGGGGEGGGVDTLSFTPVAGGMRRILGRHYVGSVRYVLGDAAATAANPPTDYSLFEWDAIGGAELALTGDAAEKYETSAYAVADAAIANPAKLAEKVPCLLQGPKDATCYNNLIVNLGRSLWRRSLSPEEVTELTGIATAAEAWAKAEPTQPDPFLSAFKYTIAAMLQSPNFLYQVEIGVPDANIPGRRNLTGLEMASRMSFFFLGHTPDDALLTSAESGLLDTDEGVRNTAWQMLADPASIESVTDFFREMLYLDDLDGLAKDASLYPIFSQQVAQAMKESSIRFVQEVVLTGADMHDLFTADYQYVNPDIAPLFNLPPPASGGFEKTVIPADQMRPGFLGSPSYLARFAHPDRTSPTRRGNFVQFKFVCTEVDPPPPGVNTTIPPDDPNNPMTLKDKLAQHQNDVNCSSCHRQIDPIGLAFENFDSVGAFRTLDNGLPIDPSGEVEGFGAFANPIEVGQILKNDPRSSVCMIKNFIRGGLGHRETPGEAEVIDLIEKAFQDSGYRIQNVMVEIAVSPLFRVVGEPK